MGYWWDQFLQGCRDEEQDRAEWLDGIRLRLQLVTTEHGSPQGPHWPWAREGWRFAGLTERVTIEAPFPKPRPAGFEHCRVYWGSHGCDLARGHADDCECDCCECGGSHPDAGDGVLCVAKAPYYGPETRFYGEDVAARGLPPVDSG
jgi:hypothetical protein